MIELFQDYSGILLAICVVALVIAIHLKG